MREAFSSVVTSVLHMLPGCTCALLCRSTSLPTMPGPRRCTVLRHRMEHSHYSIKGDLSGSELLRHSPLIVITIWGHITQHSICSKTDTRRHCSLESIQKPLLYSGWNPHLHSTKTVKHAAWDRWLVRHSVYWKGQRVAEACLYEKVPQSRWMFVNRETRAPNTQSCEMNPRSELTLDGVTQ